ATGAWADDGIVQRATRAIKREVKDMVAIGDVCLCEYMSHGHCGVVQKSGSAAPKSVGAMAVKREEIAAVATKMAADAAAEYEIANDASLEILAKMALSQARAGM